MNLIYFATSKIPSKAANSVHVMKMSSAFTSYFDKVSLVARPGMDVCDKDKIKADYGCIHDFDLLFSTKNPKKNSFLYCIGFIFSLLIRKNKSENVIYARDLYACTIAAFLGFYVAYESHGYSVKKRVRYLESLLFKRKNFLGVVVISDALKKIYLADESLNYDDIFTAHDGADIEPNNSLSSEDDVNEEREFTATYIGHLYNGRGIDIIIETAKLLPNVCFEIVGGLEKDIEFWSARSPSNVIFIGHVAPVETLKYRRRSDVLLMPYQNTVSVEGGGDTSKWMSPMKLFEYMSSKKPIISSDIPVIREVLNDKNSILVDSDDVQKWVDAIKCLKKSNELRVALSEAAYYDFVNKYTWSKRAENISVFLKDRVFKKV